jgi:hypothetical protein
LPSADGSEIEKAGNATLMLEVAGDVLDATTVPAST